MAIVQGDRGIARKLRSAERLAGRRSKLALLAVLAAVMAADRLFAWFIFQHCVAFGKATTGIDWSNPASSVITVLPDLWLALIGLVLGTLLLVVSIASQSIPRLIDIYLRNLYSIVFIWYLVIGTGHALCVMLIGPIPAAQASRVFNLHVLLPLGLLLAFPYTHYILKRSKPEDIIQHIYLHLLKGIHRLADPRRNSALDKQAAVASHQAMLFESLNQLDDMLSYIAFKSPRAAIISMFGGSLREYLRVKPSINPAFFQMTPAATNDISFLTISTQVATVERTGTVFEQKVLRLLRNAYAKMIALSEYDLASLCAKEINDTCGSILRHNVDNPARQQEALEFLIVWLNTFMRVAIKDAERAQDSRHLFNLLFYYGKFLETLVEHQRQEMVKKVFRYLQLYGEELHHKSRRNRALEFPVDVVAAEMGRALRLISERGWDEATQHDLLRILMAVDRRAAFDESDERAEKSMNVGVRVIQAGLALFYMKQGDAASVHLIIEDLREDYLSLGSERFQKAMDLICNRLRFTTPEYWEDTDRGNESFYYTPNKELIDPFRELVDRTLLERPGTPRPEVGRVS